MAGTEATLGNDISGNSTPSTSTATSPDNSNNRILLCIRDCPSSEDLTTPISEDAKVIDSDINILSNICTDPGNIIELNLSNKNLKVHLNSFGESGLSDSISEETNNESHNEEMPVFKPCEKTTVLKLPTIERQLTEASGDAPEEPNVVSNPSPSASLNADPSESQAECKTLDNTQIIIEGVPSDNTQTIIGGVPAENTETIIVGVPSDNTQTIIVGGPSDNTQTIIVGVPSNNTRTRKVGVPSNNIRTRKVGVPSDNTRTIIEGVPSESRAKCNTLDNTQTIIEEGVEESSEDCRKVNDSKPGDAGPSQGLLLTEENIRKFSAEEEGANCNSKDDSTINNWPEEEEESMGDDFPDCRSRYMWSFCELESWPQPGHEGEEGDEGDEQYMLDLKGSIEGDSELKIESDEEQEQEEDEDDDYDNEENFKDCEDLDTEASAKPGTSANSRKANPSRGRKRKSESRGEVLGRIPCKKQFPEDKTASMSLNVGGESSSSSIDKVKRSPIPTKDNPPPEMKDWLNRFKRWTNAERLLAIDRLIDTCEPMQVRHMMQVIEPQFQRDFISLLPKELALYVLSFLDPRDLLRAAQTCRSWRFLAEDNLLWREKCRAENIKTLPDSFARRRGRPGMSHASPWKGEYMRQHTVEMNWRTNPLPTPKELKGHDDHVITCLQFSGNRIVSGSDDNTLKVWSLITGKCMRTLAGHTGGVWSSQMSDNIIISGSTDRTLKVWNADSGDCIHTLFGHTSTVRCMHLHGRKVVSGSRDATLRVWDIEEGICLHVLVGHMAAVRCVQYDGKLVVSGAYDYMVKVWNAEREECLHTLQGHTNRVYSLQFDGVHVVSGSLDTSIRVWEVETGACRHTLMGHQSLTSGMELRDNILVSGNADSTVKVWDIVSGQCLQTLSGPNKHQSAVTCLQFNSRFVITSSDDGTVKLWDVRTGEFVRNLVALDSGGSGGVVWRIRASETKLVCAVGSRNGTEETKLLVLDFDVEHRW